LDKTISSLSSRGTGKLETGKFPVTRVPKTWIVPGFLSEQKQVGRGISPTFTPVWNIPGQHWRVTEFNEVSANSYRARIYKCYTGGKKIQTEGRKILSCVVPIFIFFEPQRFSPGYNNMGGRKRPHIVSARVLLKEDGGVLSH